MNRVVLLMLAMVMIFASGFEAYGQSRILTGKVVDATGEPIPGVNILGKQVNTGTNTDLEGRYSISVTNSSVLVF